MKLDPVKLVRQRQRLGYSQQNVADKSDVNRRTIERAEAGISISNESAASIAAALQTTPHALAASSTPSRPAAPLGKTITLRRAQSGRSIMDALDQSAMCKIECDVEPTEHNLELLKTLATLLEDNMPEPLNEDKVEWPPPRRLADRLDLIARLGETIAALDALGVGVFVAATWLDAYLPKYDHYERHFFWDHDKKAIGCRAVRIVISEQAMEKVVKPAWVRWPVEVDEDDEDGVPF